MKKFFAIAGAALILGACASSNTMTAQEQSDRAACRRADAPTGSNLVRRADCAPQAAAPAETKKN
jgi:hypothetical protein